MRRRVSAASPALGVNGGDQPSQPGEHLRNPAVRETKPRRIDFDVTDEIDVMIDGEAERVVPVAIDLLPAALDVCV